jgi:hypothetical protein
MTFSFVWLWTNFPRLGIRLLRSLLELASFGAVLDRQAGCLPRVFRSVLRTWNYLWMRIKGIQFVSAGLAWCRFLVFKSARSSSPQTKSAFKSPQNHTMPFETDMKRAQDEARKRGWSERVYFEVQVYDVDNCSVNEYFCPLPSSPMSSTTWFRSSTFSRRTRRK